MSAANGEDRLETGRKLGREQREVKGFVSPGSSPQDIVGCLYLSTGSLCPHYALWVLFLALTPLDLEMSGSPTYY